MKSCLEELSVFMLVVCLERIKGQCQNVGSHPTITSCDENKSGKFVFVDFHKINRSCTCIVQSFFSGELLVQITLATRLYSCTEEVVVSLGNEIVIFKCDFIYPTSDTFKVEAIYTPVKITANYKAGFSLVNFYPCLQLKENGNTGGKEGVVSVTCSNSAINPTTISNTPTTTRTTTRTTTAATISPQTSSSTYTYNTTITVDSSPQKSTYASSDNVTYIITGAAAGALVLVVIVMALVAIVVLRKKKRGKHDKTQIADEASEHTNRAFDKNCGLPDNPLYHSAQPMDEVGYSSVQKNQLGLPPTEATIKKNKDPSYDISTNNKPIYDSDTSPMPIYAVPNKSGASPPEGNELRAMYAQVLKPSKSTTQVPMQSINQGGLVYLKVEKDATPVNENISYNQNENKDGVLYAEIKRN